MSDATATIRRVEKRDINKVAILFSTGFPGSMETVFGKKQANLESLEDIFAFLRSNCEQFYVAELDGEVVGYIITPANMKYIWRKAMKSSFLIKALWRFITGKYQISLIKSILLIRNKLTFIKIPATWEKDVGQILSIAVDPGKRGMGIGKMLVREGLDSLKEQRVKGVKLEVRPKNKAAYKLYRSLGFTLIGQAVDSQGKWLVMKKNLD